MLLQQVPCCVSTDASGQVRHWHVSTKQCLSTIHEERHTLAARFAHDHLTFATAGSDSKVHIYDYPTNTLLSVLEPRFDTYVYITNVPVCLCMHEQQKVMYNSRNPKSVLSSTCT